MPDVFFLVEERSEPGLGDLSKPTTPVYLLGVKLMFVGVMKYLHSKYKFSSNSIIHCAEVYVVLGIYSCGMKTT